MAESESEDEITNLKETVFAQQRLLQKLYNELEVERESSAIAASEALAMILRLQGEKGVVKMEAEQYKRLTKEKMCHAQESLSVSEQLIYQREMEVAALDYQLQAYRYKLLSIGGVDPTIGQLKFSNDLLQRRNSAPVFPLRYVVYQKKAIIDESSEQVGKLDDRVKEIDGDNYGNSSQVQHDLRASSFENEIYDSNSTPGVLDVFEVPRIDQHPKDEGLARLDSVPREALISDKNETDRLMKLLKRSSEKKLHTHLEFMCSPARISDYQAKFNEHNEAESSSRGEELKLLNEIKLQLNGIQSEVSSLKTTSSSPRDEQYLVSFMELSLMEAMLHFWL